MKAIVCEMCGSQDLIKQDGYYVCQSCGTKYDPEEAKKLMVEVSGSVKVDNTEKLQNYYQLARRAAADNSVKDAAKYYDLIRQEDANSWEAQYYAVYFDILSDTKIGEILNASYLLQNTANTVLSMIEAQANPDDDNSRSEAARAVVAVANDTEHLFVTMFEAAKSNASKFSDTDEVLNSFFFDDTLKLCMAFNGAAKEVLKYSIIDFENIYPVYIEQLEKENEILADGWNFYAKNSKLANVDSRNIVVKMIDMNNEIIKKHDSTYSSPGLHAPKASSGGCYVATAVYGSYDCPQVWTLRRYRDDVLAETWYGRAFIRAYYAISPTMVKWFGDADWFRGITKPTLDRKVRKLNQNGVADTPYTDR